MSWGVRASDLTGSVCWGPVGRVNVCWGSRGRLPLLQEDWESPKSLAPGNSVPLLTVTACSAQGEGAAGRWGRAWAPCVVP